MDLEVPAPKFHQNDRVVMRSHRNMVGIIECDPDLDGGEYWYRVRFSKRVENIVEDDLDLLAEDEKIADLACQGRWGRLDAFRQALAVERITNVNRSTVYAFNAQRLTFEPYQYKPLLKILDSHDRRLLIADEVGLGKTIEAGLILTELEARRPLNKILVVCPSRLLEKWREEMNRKFEQDFEIFNGQRLREYIRKHSESTVPRRLRAIISMQTLRGDDLRSELTAEVNDIDLVVVDEAHHARNPATLTSEMCRDLGLIGQAVLLLTATPLHLGSSDLFTLLQALRPNEFRDLGVFDRELQEYQGVFVAEQYIRSRTPESVVHAQAILKDIFINKLLPEMRNPVAEYVIDHMDAHCPKESSDWAELERMVHDLHPLASVLTRTRKRDVQEHAPVRRSHVVKCPWTPQEDLAYQQLVAGTASRGWIGQRLTFSQITRARQAASCLPAVLEAHGMVIKYNDDEMVELSDILPSDIKDKSQLEDAPDHHIPVPVCTTDSKFDKLLEILRHIYEEEPEAKILIFMYFKPTARYLERRLTEQGWPTIRIDGEVPSDPRRPERDERAKRIKRFKEDPEIRILVSTEVGSEGLDFQFCHHLINYDLPWNPMVVEQRIGRIDRFGQRSKVVHIYSLVVEGTVEDRILSRLYDRIGIFEQSLGALETILGETVRELQREFVSGELTPEEADLRLEQACRAIENRKLDLDKLEESAAELFGHEEFIRNEMERVRKLGRFLSERALLSVISGYLRSQHPDVRIFEKEKGIYALRLTDQLKWDIQRATQDSRPWIDKSQEGLLLITTQGEIAFNRPEVDLINTSHPLLKAAVAALSDVLKDAVARVGHAELRIKGGADDSIPPGHSYLVIFANEISGLRQRRILHTLAWSQEQRSLLDSESSERLMHLIMEQATEWENLDPSPALESEIWNEIISSARKYNRDLREKENRENEALYVRRRQTLIAEHDSNRELLKNKMATAIKNKQPERILRMFRGQIDKRESAHQKQMKEMESAREVSVTLSDPLAVCLVKVVKV